jgi:hypothetical protein
MKTFNEFLAESNEKTITEAAPKGQGDVYEIRAFESKMSDFVKLLKRGYKFYTGNGTTEIRDFDKHRSIRWVAIGTNSKPEDDFKKFGVVTKFSVIKDE